MNAKEFYNSACEISSGNREIDYRNAISRTYYAAYHSCEQWRRDNQLEIAAAGTTHDKLIITFIDNSNKEVKGIGNRLNQLKAKRHLADYNLKATFSKSEVMSMLNQTNKILEWIASHPKLI